MDPILSTQSTTVAARAQPGTKEAGASAALSSDFETFLRMLTVQVQNQDPMNPVDSTEYATQLATFSSVEQQVRTNELLSAMSARLGVGGLQDVGSWIGMEGLVRAPVRFSGDPITLRPDLHPEADAGILIVRAADGTVVERYAFDSAEDSFVWSGTDDTGAPYPEGVYRFEIESYDGEARIDTQLSRVYSRIVEIRSDNGDILVRFEDGSERPTSMVDGLRSA